MSVKYNLPETNEWITKLLRFHTLFVNTEKTEAEQTEYNQLISALAPYQIRAEDINGKLDTTGNAASASKWATGRKITLGGDASGEITIDGSANGTLTVTISGLASKLDKAGGTMTGILTAQNNTYYTTKQVRNIILSTADANASLMENGDIWLKYE